MGMKTIHGIDNVLGSTLSHKKNLVELFRHGQSIFKRRIIQMQV